MAHEVVAVWLWASAMGRGEGGPETPRTPAVGMPHSHRWMPTPACITASVVPDESHSQKVATPLSNWCERSLAFEEVS
eukprot:scaffold14318_cov28-Tisochrysis_lutea.AAC.1